jgi:ATP-dependent DNA ligase
MLPGDHQFADRQTGNGILNKANKGTISAEEAALIHASVWDVIPYVLFCDSYCGAPYSKRFNQLHTMLKNVKTEGKRIWTVTSTIVETIEQAQEIFQEYLALGHEGIILKDGNGIWEDKRAKHQIKFKGELECDLRIVGIEEGTGKYKGMLGAIICESEDGIVKTRCGSGFNDEQRKTLGQEIVGKIVAIKYNMRSVDKQGKQSLFLPIVLEIREDKSTADTSDTIK